MPSRKEEPANKPHARRMYAEELKKLREEAGWSQAELAEKSTLDRTHLSRLESGERLGERRNAEILDRVYGTGRHLQNLWTLAKDDVYLDRYKRYMELEDKARVIQVYHPQTVPGLLQTEEYAREQLWSTPHRPDEEGWLEEQLALRMERQAILRRADSPPHLRVILDEAVFRRPLKDSDAWNRQLKRLLDDAQLPNVTVQVLPFGPGVHDLLGGALIIMWLPNGTQAAYLESAKSGEVIEEPDEVEQHKLSYDEISVHALSPKDSLEFIRNLMKDG